MMQLPYTSSSKVTFLYHLINIVSYWLHYLKQDLTGKTQDKSELQTQSQNYNILEALLPH